MAEMVHVEGSMTPPARHGVGGTGLERAQLIPILIGLLLGMLLAALDQTVVNTAMPRVIADLGGQNISWVYTSYLLASTVSVPIYGKLSDIYGRRVFFLGGMVVFLLGSALSGTSGDMTQLIIYRGIQGLGAGALMPIAMAIIGDIFPPAERGKWQGLFTGVFGLATIVGPVLGGWLTDNLSWRWVFYVNMPVGAIALVAASLTLPRMTARRAHKIDYIGTVMLVLWAVPLLLALSFGGSEYAWNSWQIIGLFAFAAAMLVTFVVFELRTAEPILNPRLLLNPIFGVSVLAMFLLTFALFGATAFLPFFTQSVMGQSATNSGVVLTPLMLGFIVSSLIGGQLISRTGRYKIIAMVSFAGGAVGMFLLSRMDVNTTNAELVRNMVVTGLGIGAVMSLFTIVVQNAFPLRQIGEVTSTLTFFRSMGGVIGLAVLSAVLTNVFGSELTARIPAVLRPYVDPSKLMTQGSKGGGNGALSAKLAQFGPQATVLVQQLHDAVKISFATAISHIFVISTALMIVGFVAVVFLREIPLRKTQGSVAEQVQGKQSAAEIGNELGEAAPVAELVD